MAKFKIYKDRSSEYRWHLVSNNGEKICWAEGYSSKQNAKKSIQFVTVNAPSAKIEDHTGE